MKKIVENLNHFYRGRIERFMYYMGIYTPSLQICIPTSHSRVLTWCRSYFPVIFSNLKSLTTIYLLNPIQPQRNHLIWLLCAVVIAVCATLTSPGPLKNNNGLGWSPIFLVEKAIDIKLTIESKKLVYFLTIETDVRVYKSTGHPHPGRLCMRDAMKCRAPWKREIWFGCEETPNLSKVIRTSIVAVGASTDLFFIGFLRFGAKASERRVAILCLSHTVVMLSGKSLVAINQKPFGGWMGRGVTYGLSIT